MSKITLRLLLVWTIFISLMMSVPSFSEDYYRWVDAQGVVHYGSRPPEGVDAVKINTYGKSESESAPLDNSTPLNNKATGKNGQATKTDSERTDLVALRQAQCKEERERLRVLQTPGSRIRMEQTDGSVKYLSPDEVALEVDNSQKFLSEACQ